MFKWYGRGDRLMAEMDGAQDDALARLEAALERIARHAEAAAEPASQPVPAFDPAPVAARLDALIGVLRAELGDAGTVAGV